ncbi:nuclear transport factor 2 family protein [Streptomyces sp. Je 1-4]|uniref:nuclear transport factor 2 family protein n=1 Tax=Streptomyces TaxID=1883 RepID=UPI00140F4173|nr:MULTISPECIES: nuclear transport factor 2 family protein [unclassified Streptomyces]QIK07842.1 nuclear transport factor 2 family protein [Streptomyces sp. ID38640]UYB41452.1 nuclear transport factor 2 family protein [Streptomyces sp. Je 1-4]UZQ37687.1 nuclear transport factor 2 family protein [Streptomyces sp. Je 1-4] [Streptomyces sp. Je 1-4 4N24]UZQ45104.1 nuclear transport factor 2 family protein [Streptomyces sp. Je 1-4] [Streptomyces sp. Je 1-4 4N24_ara]
MTFLPDAGYVPTAEDRASLEAWFVEYDAQSAKRDVQSMADLAMFPLNLVSDDAAGNGRAAQWDREQYIATMTQVMGDGSEDITFESTRTPVFLSPVLAVVFSDSTMTMGGRSRQLRYADILVRRDGAWAFQTMIQGGWGDNL